MSLRMRAAALKGSAAKKIALSLSTPVSTPDFFHRDDIRDAELILTAFRTLLLVVIFTAPFTFSVGRRIDGAEIFLIAVASIYNLGMGISGLFPGRYGVRRPLILVMDSLLIAVWMHLSERWELVSFYYVVVVVAAMWYRVVGGILAAIMGNFCFLFLWGRVAANAVLYRPPTFTASMGINMVLLFVVGTLTGYLSEAQDRDRARRLERELLLANYEREIDLSAQLQPLLMARFENNRHLDLGAALQSARSVGGGDYLDALPLDEGRTLLCIADVAGKSARAQAHVPLLKYSLRALVPLHHDLAALTQHLQSSLLPDLAPEHYIALCLVLLDCPNGRLTWCNAGHMAPLRVRRAWPADAQSTEDHSPTYEKSAPQITALETTMPALGLFPEMEARTETLDFRAGDVLLLYTDGLADALSFGGSVDGEIQVQKLAARLNQGATLASKDAAQELVDLATSALDKPPAPARRFGLGERDAPTIHRDDVAVLIARFRE